MSTTNGHCAEEQLLPKDQQPKVAYTQEFIELTEAFGHLSNQVSSDHLVNQEKFGKIQEKLEIWIRTNQSLMEGQQETARANYRLVEAILANTSEMQKTTQEQQRSANLFETGTRLLGELENRLKALEKQTQGFAQETNNLNGILTILKPVFDKTATVMEVLTLQLPQNAKNTSSKKFKSQKLSPSQELNDSLNQSESEGQDDEQIQTQTQSLSQNHLSQLKRFIAITRRDVLLTSRFSLGWGVFSTLVLLVLVGYNTVTNSGQFNTIINKIDNVQKVLPKR